MTAHESHAIEVLNRLYAEEVHSLLPRLAESSPFVSWAEAGELAALERMIREEREHRAWLVEAIESADGAVYPVSPDASTSNLHYLDLGAVMPRVIAVEERQARVFAEASARGGLTPEAATVVGRIAQRHQQHLDQLRKLHSRAEAGQAVR